MIVISCCLFETITNATFNLVKRKNNSLTCRLGQNEINDVKKTKLWTSKYLWCTYFNSRIPTNYHYLITKNCNMPVECGEKPSQATKDLFPSLREVSPSTIWFNSHVKENPFGSTIIVNIKVWTHTMPKRTVKCKAYSYVLCPPQNPEKY